MKESLTWRTTIAPHLIKKKLLQGLGVACVGLAPLLYGGVWVHAATLQVWGFCLFLFCFGLIAKGFIPYRCLSRLQLKPNELCLTHSGHLEFYSGGSKRLTISLKAIVRLHYIPHREHYGIALWLKSGDDTEVQIHRKLPKTACLQIHSSQGTEAGFFFLYFSQRTFQEVYESCI
jgi:hypothetical protein